VVKQGSQLVDTLPQTFGRAEIPKQFHDLAEH
jgi:hypothetical protein